MSAALGLVVAERREVWATRRLPVRGQVWVTPGQRVEAETVLARALLPGRVLTVPLAGLLGCEPGEAASRAVRAPGESVAAGDLLARSSGVWGLGARQVQAPADGTVEHISAASGQLTLRCAPEPVDVVAHLPGRVAAVLPGEGAVVACVGAHVQGVYGVGGEVRGRLAQDVARGCVLLVRAADAGLLRRAAAGGAAAVIAGGVPYLDLQSAAREHPGLVVVLTEGFGVLPMGERAWAILAARGGQAACVDGTTQIRAGVVRPEVVVPAGGDASPPLQSAAPRLRPGARVRLVRDPAFGRTGTVLQLPALPRPVDSGAVVRVAVVALDGGGVATVPQANLEVVG